MTGAHSSIVFSRVRVFDGSGGAPVDGEVRIEGNRIAEVSRGAERVSRQSARVIDGHGGVLMPIFASPSWTRSAVGSVHEARPRLIDSGTSNPSL